MANSLERYALITGASSGIGKATALAFARYGINLALVARSQPKLEAVVADIVQLGGQAKAYAIDLGIVEHVRKRIQTIVDDLGAIDILVNCAGMGYTGTLMDTPLQDWQQVLNVNLTSVFQCVLGVLPQMRSQRRGLIINVASIAAHQVFPGWGAYCVSKFGLLALSKAIASEERSHVIRVTTISPGSVNTPLWDTDTVHADFPRTAMLTPEVVAQTIVQTALLPDSAVAEEVILMPNVGTF
ncbi:MAG: SDR family oxidoreductase [Cyanobacteriota bacterium SKYGB_h_bin112]|nr:SDR family oxidoreductase [Cyanobacteriota bacterium SKYGB_h_bin112]